MFFGDTILIFVSFIILLVMILIGVAFLTLLERKVLNYIQIRKGPNKVGFLGLIQPFSEAFKLFSKEQIYPFMSNYLSYYFSPIFSLFLSLILWFCLPFLSSFLYFNLGFLFLLCVSSLGVHSMMIAGWSSNSNYSMLGGLRCVAQTISYEVSLSIILLSILFLISSLSILDLILYQDYVWFIYLSLPLSMAMIVSLLAETNRTPFDVAEGESELVSGFNVEYSGGGFLLIFMAEYSWILFMSMVFVFLFLGGSLLNFMFFLLVTLISFLFIWIRGTLPRFRYDKLMYLAWKSFLPISLNYLMYFFGLKMIIFSLII